MKNTLDLFTRGKDFLWTDEHIAKKMLALHLDGTHDAASRNIETIDKTLQWIHRNIKPHSTISDYGCGPGIYAEKLTLLGHEVSGMDISSHSINYARQSAENNKLSIEYTVGNYLEGDFSDLSDAALCIYCDFGALIPDEQTLFLKKIHKSLNNKGILIFDVFSDRFSDSQVEKRQWDFCESEDFWCRNPHYTLSESVHFADSKSWGHRTIVIDCISGEEKEFITWDQYYSEKEIETLLYDRGFSVEKIETHLVLKNDFTSNEVLFVKAVKK